MVAFLSPEWVERQRELLKDLPGGEDVSVRVRCVVTGGPDGDVTYHLEFDGGRAVSGGPGPGDEPDVVLTTTYEVARDIARGDLEPSVAFMQGVLKTQGPTAQLVPLLALTQSPAYQAAAERLRAETEL
ncbi:MAG TPA: SCP2 sterol-binding domain-containing protein [Acidimicrobiales bacterium]